MDDRSLIARVLAGDAGAERELYQAHVDRVFRLVYRLAGDGDRAQDYTQETFVRAFERLGEFRGEAALSTWLCSIAVSVALKGIRKTRRLRAGEVAFDEVPAGPAAPLDAGAERLRVQPADPAAAPLEFDNPNFALASLRGNAVLRWEYRPGSTLFPVWTQKRSDTVLDGRFRLGDGLGRLGLRAGENVFLVKLSYWWRP